MQNQQIHKDDVSILDNIIGICIENNIARPENLPPLGTGFMDEIKDIKESDYSRYFRIIQDFNVAEVIISKGMSYVKPLNVDTERFYRDGGFTKLYSEQQKHKKLELILHEKEINEAVLTKWHKKTYWFTFGIAIAGFLIAIAALILTLK